MVSLSALWLPLLLSAVLVFFVSSLLHMVLPFHKSDYGKLPSEGEVLAALRTFNIPPGDYLAPSVSSPSELKDPAFLAKREKGPVMMVTIMPSGPPSMGAPLAQWFVYCMVVGLFAAYVASRALGPGAPYLSVFRFVGTTAFVGYTLALWQNTIWYKRNWVTTFKSTVDGLIYALLTAGMFGWLWPR